MPKMQKYGIKYPFTCDNEEKVYLDVNETYSDGIKSQLLHVIFTPKGQKIRDPEFGTDLIRYIYEQNDEETLNNVKSEIVSKVNKYVPAVTFEDFNVFKNDNNEIIVTIKYSVKIGNRTEETTVAVKL